MNKLIIAIALFSIQALVNAQEPVKENNSVAKTPPSSSKAINEKGVSPVKTRGLTKKSVNAPAPAAETTTAAPIDESVNQDKPQQTEPVKEKKEKKNPKKGTTTEKAINEKGVSPPKTRDLKAKSKSSSTNSTTTEEPKK